MSGTDPDKEQTRIRDTPKEGTDLYKEHMRLTVIYFILSHNEQAKRFNDSVGERHRSVARWR